MSTSALEGFVRLTRAPPDEGQGNAVFVQVDRIDWVEPSGVGVRSRLFVGGYKGLIVEESVEEVMRRVSEVPAERAVRVVNNSAVGGPR